jgi:hypothetical protein
MEEWIIKEIRMNSTDSGQGPVAGSCEHDNESSGSIKWKFLDQLSDSF